MRIDIDLLCGSAALALLLATACSTAESASAPPTGDPTGRWITASGNAEVEIAPCGEALCGTIVQVLANRSMHGPGAMQPADARDPLGMRILIDLVPTEGTPTEWRGQVYDREKAKTYSAVVTLDAPDTLAVRGYVGLPVFGRTQAWRRAAP